MWMSMERNKLTVRGGMQMKAIQVGRDEMMTSVPRLAEFVACETLFNSRGIGEQASRWMLEIDGASVDHHGN